MLRSIALPLLSLLSLALAKSTCDSSNAMTAEQFVASVSGTTTTPSTDSGASGGSSCAIYPACPYCDQDPTFELCRSWHESQLQNGFNAGVLGGASLFGKNRRSLSLRASTLECEDEEACVAAGTGLYFCINPNSLDFHDSNGGSGNADSDTYTMANGEVTVVASTATGLPTPTGSGSKTTAASAEAETTSTSSGAKTTASLAPSASGNSDSSAAAIVKAESFAGLALVMLGAAVAWL